jgi:hypothetical protein
VGIPFAISSGKNIKKAVKTQNEADQTSQQQIQNHFLQVRDRWKWYRIKL